MIHRLRDHRISIAKAAPVAAFCLFKTLCAMTALAWVLAAFEGQAAERQVPRTKAEAQLSFAPLVKKAAPAVVKDKSAIPRLEAVTAVKFTCSFRSIRLSALLFIPT